MNVKSKIINLIASVRTLMRSQFFPTPAGAPREGAMLTACALLVQYL